MGRQLRLLFTVLLGVTVVLATEQELTARRPSHKQVKSAVHPNTSFSKHVLLDCVKRNCLSYQTDVSLLDRCILEYCGHNNHNSRDISDKRYKFGNFNQLYGVLFRTAAVDCARLCTEEEYTSNERKQCMTSCVKETVQSLQRNLFQSPGKKWVDSLTFAKKSKHIPEKKWVDSLTFAKKSGYLPEKKWVDSLTFAKRYGEIPEKKWVDTLTFHKRAGVAPSKKWVDRFHERAGVAPSKKWVDSLTFAKRAENNIPDKKWVDSLTFHKRDNEIEDQEEKARWTALSQANRRKISDDKRWVDSLTFHKKSAPYENEGTERINQQGAKVAPKRSSFKAKRRSRRWVDELDYGKRSAYAPATIQKRWVDELHFGKRDTTEVRKKWVDTLHFAGKRGFDDLLELCIEERCVGLKGDAFDQCSGELCVEPMAQNRASIESRLQRRHEQPSAFCKLACHNPEKRDMCLTYCV